MEKLSHCQQLADRLPRIVFVLCVVQPCMDVLSFWVDQAGITNALTLMLRFGLLIFMTALGMLVTDRRRYYWVMLAVLGIFTVCHMLVCSLDGYLDPIGDLANLVRIYQLPLTTLAFITYLRQRPECLISIRRGFFWCLVIIAAVEVLSVFTGTNPYTYPSKSIGILGWFYFANAQSAILSMAVPVALVYAIERTNYDPRFTLAAAAAGLGMLYLFATRLSYAALLGTGAGLAISLLILRKTRKLRAGRAAAVLLACAAVAAFSFPVSPTYVNVKQQEGYRDLKQEDIDGMVARDDAAAEAAGLTGEARRVASLRSAYETYLNGPTLRFGLERTVRLYDYSTNADILADARLRRLSYCRLLLEDKPEYRFFGAELAEMEYNGANHDVENDFYGIYVLCGGVGLTLMLLFLGRFAVRIVRVLIRDFKSYFTLEAAGFGIALICGLAHCYFTAGVLRRPNAVFYLAVVLAAIEMLTREKKERIAQSGKEVDP